MVKCKICDIKILTNNKKRKIDYNKCNFCSNKLYDLAVQEEEEFIVIKKEKLDIKNNIIKPVYKKKTTCNTIDNIDFNNITKNYKNQLLNIDEFITVINYNKNMDVYINKFLPNLKTDEWIKLDHDLKKILNYTEINKYINEYIQEFHDIEYDYILSNVKNVTQNTKTIKNLGKNTNIYINLHCFKSICEFINTKQSKIIKHDVIEFEKIYKKYIQYTNFYKDNKLTDSKLIKNLQINKQLHEFSEYIYIVTTRQKAKENIFKVGRTQNLKNRLCSYNTGSALTNKYFYCSHYKCTSASTLENRIFSMLKNFKIPNEKEMFQLHYDVLNNIIKIACTNDKKICENINNFIEVEYIDYFSLDPIEF